MAENRCSCGQGTASGSNARESFVIDTMRVLDSCRDRDCYEDVRVYLTPCGQELIDRTATVRTVDAKILGTTITVDAVPFNRGFYQINVRFYIRLKNEACVCAGTTREFTALAIADKSVVLYGGEGGATVFRSSKKGGFCGTPSVGEGSESIPEAVVEVVSPIVLASRVACCENASTSCSTCNSCSSCDTRSASACGCEVSDTVPCEIAAHFPEGLAQPTGDSNRLFVSLGIFSIIRLERSAQLMISGVEYSVPDKECRPACDDEDPCCLFRSMAFPKDAFKSSVREGNGKHNR